MPDPLKIAAIEGAGVRCLHVCGSCSNFNPGKLPPARAIPLWGSCTLIRPQHQKHADGGRMSVRADMTCPSHVITLAADSDLYASGMDHLRVRT